MDPTSRGYRAPDTDIGAQIGAAGDQTGAAGLIGWISEIGYRRGGISYLRLRLRRHPAIRDIRALRVIPVIRDTEPSDTLRDLMSGSGVWAFGHHHPAVWVGLGGGWFADPQGG